jgi:glutaredoxin
MHHAMYHRILPLSLLMLAIVLVAPEAQAQKLYKWVDRNGNVTYTDSKPPENAGMVEEREIQQVSEDQPLDIEQLAEANPITFYSVPACDSCDMVRNYLTEQDLPFTEVNVESDIDNQNAMKAAVGNLSVPTLTVGTRAMTGYNRDGISAMLEVAGYPVTAAAAATAGTAEEADTAEAEAGADNDTPNADETEDTEPAEIDQPDNDAEAGNDNN